MRPHFRHGTLDASIHAHVIDANEYRLPANMTGATVIDVGAHCGFFSRAVLSRGASKVYAFEADAENVGLAHDLLAPDIAAGRVELRHLAVWRSDRAVEYLSVSPYPDYHGAVNTGGARVADGDVPGRAVRAVALDEVIAEAAASAGGKVDLLKIDAEGNEWPILLTAKRLDAVGAICGEFHEFATVGNPEPATFQLPDHGPSFSQGLLVEVLTRHGFRVRSRRTYDTALGRLIDLGLFWADRKQP